MVKWLKNCFLLRTVALTLSFAGALNAYSPVGSEVPFDLVLLNGRIVDGTGNPWFLGDIGIRGNHIARVAPGGMLREAPAREQLDVRGMVVAPGFIDIQSQSGVQFLKGDSRVISKVTQGVTTEILGEGWTPAPSNALVAKAMLFLDPEVAEASKEFTEPHGFAKWLGAMQRHGASTNLGSFLGGATARIYVKGMTEGTATEDELERMRAVVQSSMEDGAFGIAPSLMDPPESFVTTDELVALAQAMAPYGGVYISHIRSEGDRFLEGLDEAIEIGRRGGVPVEIYHFKGEGIRNWTKVAQAIDKINAARTAGQDVGADMYPYTAGATSLAACLPPWASADQKLLDNLRNPQTRARIRDEVLHQRTYWENLCELATPQGSLIVGVHKPENRKFVGRRLSEIATEEKKDWVDAAMDLILTEQQWDGVNCVFFHINPENLEPEIRQPWMKFGTDGEGVDPATARDMVHPRDYGTYPRILGKYVREENVIPLEEAVRKMTSEVANRLSIRDRGLLREGMYADIVVFDPQTVADRATYEEPHQLSVGVPYVLVNGVFVVRDGKHTGAKPGLIVRGPGYKKSSM